MTTKNQYLITVDNNVSQLKNQPFCLSCEYDYTIPSTVSDYNHVHTIMGIHYDPETDNGGYYDLLVNMVNQGGPKTLLKHYNLANHHKSIE